MVRGGRGLQVGAEARVGGEELGLVGAEPLQQHLGGAAQWQGGAHRALPPPAARGRAAGLRHRLPGLLRRRRLAAPLRLRRLLRPAHLPRLQRVEQVLDHPDGAAHPRPPGGR